MHFYPLAMVFALTYLLSCCSDTATPNTTPALSKLTTDKAENDSPNTLQVLQGALSKQEQFYLYFDNTDRQFIFTRILLTNAKISTKQALHGLFTASENQILLDLPSSNTQFELTKIDNSWVMDIYPDKKTSPTGNNIISFKTSANTTTLPEIELEFTGLLNYNQHRASFKDCATGLTLPIALNLATSKQLTTITQLKPDTWIYSELSGHFAFLANSHKASGKQKFIVLDNADIRLNQQKQCSWLVETENSTH